MSGPAVKAPCARLGAVASGPARLASVGRRAAVLLALCLGALLTLSAAEDPSAAFDAANKLYEQGKYSAAVEAYTKLLEAGQSSAPLYFNLGNAYFKAGQTGRAIAAYRLAERLAPRDPDIRANLQFIRQAVTGKAEAGAKGWRRWLGRLTLNEWTCLAAVAGWFWLGLLAMGQWRAAWRKPLHRYAVTSFVVFILLGLCLSMVAVDRFATTTAIVVGREVQARQAYFDESKTIFPLPDGSELTVLRTKDDWLEVRDAAQRVGWIKRHQVIFFPPPRSNAPPKTAPSP